MKLLLTGGTGFFGKALLRHLARGHRQGDAALPEDVLVLSRAPERFLSRHPEFAGLDWLHFHAGDIQIPESLPSGRRFTHVLHAAADSTDAACMDALARYHQIAHGTENLLQYAVRSGAQRFLLTSSGAVYGPQAADLPAFPETLHTLPDPMVAGNVYGLAKRQAEHLCALYQDRHGLETISARCFAFVGRDLPRDAHFAIGNFIRDALAGTPITVAGDGTALRSYLDQDDLAHWLITLLQRAPAGEAFNVGSDEAVSIATLAKLVRDALAPELEVRVLGRPGEGTARHRYLPDIAKARRMLGLGVTHPLRAAILRAARPESCSELKT